MINQRIDETSEVGCFNPHIAPFNLSNSFLSSHLLPSSPSSFFIFQKDPLSFSLSCFVTDFFWCTFSSCSWISRSNGRFSPYFFYRRDQCVCVCEMFWRRKSDLKSPLFSDLPSLIPRSSCLSFLSASSLSLSLVLPLSYCITLMEGKRIEREGSWDWWTEGEMRVEYQQERRRISRREEGSKVTMEWKKSCRCFWGKIEKERLRKRTTKLVLHLSCFISDLKREREMN